MSQQKYKRVSLVTPPYHSGVVESAGTWLNLGFVYIAGALRQAGYQVVKREKGRGVELRRDTPKVGRNDPCPCGSGKKFKKCCLH